MNNLITGGCMISVLMLTGCAKVDERWYAQDHKTGVLMCQEVTRNAAGDVVNLQDCPGYGKGYTQ